VGGQFCPRCGADFLRNHLAIRQHPFADPD
jgi:ribosomal protein S27AE